MDRRIQFKDEKIIGRDESEIILKYSEIDVD